MEEEEEEEREEEDVKIKQEQEKDWEAKMEAGWGVGSECKQEKVPQLPIGR